MSEMFNFEGAGGPKPEQVEPEQVVPDKTDSEQVEPEKTVLTNEYR